MSGGLRRRDMITCRGGKAELEAQYEDIGRLGHGGFGTVKRARHRTTGLLRAVKTVRKAADEDMPPDRGESWQVEEWVKIMAEVEALMELDHPNIVRLYEYYKDDHALYLVEELCSGGTLEQRLDEEGGRLSADDAAIALRQMLRGLLCCHAHGMAHRDLKPDNFVYATGSHDTSAALKMIDFGLSVHAAPSKGGPSPEKTYVKAAGTLEYTAPETLPRRDDATGELKREATYTQAADMWSIGCIFYLLLTGEPLVDLERSRSSTAEFLRLVKSVVKGVERDLLDDVASKIRSEKFLAARLALARRRAPPAACELLEKMLVLEPQKRLTAAQALKDRFITDSYLAAPVLAKPGDFDADIVPKMRRYVEAPALRRLAVMVEAHLLGPQDDEAVMRDVLTFRAADRRGLGALRAADIAHALASQGLDVPDDLDEILECIDLDQNGAINLLEFQAATMDPRLFCEPRLCRAAFRVLDADGDGFITQADLEKVLMEGDGRSQMAREILAEVETTAAPPTGGHRGQGGARAHPHGGRIDFARFCEVMLPKGVEPSLAARVAEYMGKSFV